MSQLSDDGKAIVQAVKDDLRAFIPALIGDALAVFTAPATKVIDSAVRGIGNQIPDLTEEQIKSIALQRLLRMLSDVTDPYTAKHPSLITVQDAIVAELKALL